jgi:hypothetical protein
VAKGYHQVKGRDYKDTFAAVVHAPSLRCFLVVCHERGWYMQQIDVKSAFLNGDLDEELWINPPPGFEPANKNIRFKLNKAIYGLKQAWQCLVSHLEPSSGRAGTKTPEE